MTDTGFGVTDPSKQGRIAEPFADDRNFGVDADFSDPRHPVSHGVRRRRYGLHSGGLCPVSADDAGRRYAGRAPLSQSADGAVHDIGPAWSVKPGPLYLPGPGYHFGLGVAVRVDAGVAPFPGSVGDWYWGGAGGTYMWVDPAQDMAVVFMMQSPKQRLHYRSVVRDLVNAAIVQ